MGETVVLRARAARALGAVLVVLTVAALVSTLYSGPEAIAAYAGLLALAGLLGWAAFWNARVEVSDGGVTVVNTWRSTHVPWPALEEVQGRYGLRLLTAYGPVTAWAAQAPAGRQRARGEDSESAALVRRRWRELQEAGFLDDARLERPSPQVRWHGATLTGAALCTAATVAGVLLG